MHGETVSETAVIQSLAPECDAPDPGAQWTALAQDVARAASGAEAGRGDARGELLVIGSGISLLDFTREAEAEILAADRVFHCLYDSVTLDWLLERRPDALDLRLLYNGHTARYFTYVQMAEVLLHYVRRGEKVLAIYYGHPGVFATPAHRAIQIARREGHRAQMRPGISALDYLIAEVGFDPAIPGMVNYEATDMLLRRRRIDTTLHVVLWQVGVVGEFGFSVGGFENRGFDILVDALEQAYGADWPVTHYIASQFVSVDAVIERFPIGDLRNPEVRRRINALSTFYLEPRDAVATDEERSVALGLTREGEPVQPPERAYDNARYGALEADAIRQLEQFAPPDGYALPRSSPAMAFMRALSEDADLRRRFREDPDAVLRDARFSELSDRARRLLAIPHTVAIDRALAEGAYGE
jgi:hypothetical protein